AMILTVIAFAGPPVGALPTTTSIGWPTGGTVRAEVATLGVGIALVELLHATPRRISAQTAAARLKPSPLPASSCRPSSVRPSPPPRCLSRAHTRRSLSVARFPRTGRPRLQEPRRAARRAPAAA